MTITAITRASASPAMVVKTVNMSLMSAFHFLANTEARAWKRMVATSVAARPVTVASSVKTPHATQNVHPIRTVSKDVAFVNRVSQVVVVNRRWRCHSKKTTKSSKKNPRLVVPPTVLNQ